MEGVHSIDKVKVIFKEDKMLNILGVNIVFLIFVVLTLFLSDFMIL